MAEIRSRNNIHRLRRRRIGWLGMRLPLGVAAALAVLLGALILAPREGVAQEGERGRPTPMAEAPVTRPEPTPGFDLIEPPAPEPHKPAASRGATEVAPSQAGGIGPAGPVAATVAYTSGNVITFADMADLAASLSVEWDDGSLSYYFYSTDALSAGSGCTQVNSFTAYCYAPTAVTISALMGTGAADGDDSVAVYDLDAADALTVSGGAGNDVLQVGAYGYVDGFGPTSFAGQGGSDALVVVDLFNPTGSSYGVESTYLQRSGVNANYYDSTVEAVALQTSASDDSVYIGSTNAATQLTVYGGTGNDTVYVGTNFELDPLDGPIFVDGMEGSDDIEVYDHGSQYSGIYGVTYNNVARAGFGGLAYMSYEGLSILAGEGANTFNVTSSNIWTPVTIYAGAGDDVFNVGPDLDAIQSKVRTHGGSNLDVLLVDDRASTDTDPITLDAGMFSRPNSGGVEFAEVEGLTLEGQPLGANVSVDNLGVPLTANTNAGDDKIFIFGGSAQVTVNAGAGNDVVTWGDGDLDSAPPAAVNAGPGGDLLFIDDDLVSYSDNYYIDSSTFYRGGSYLLVYSDFEQFYLQAEYGQNFFYVDGTAAGVPYYINARGGNDSALVGLNDGNINAILGPIVFSGEGDFDSVYVIDSGLATGETYFVRGGRIERTGGPADIDFTSDTELAQLQAGASGDTINLVGTALGSSTDIYGNAGNDTVSVFAAGLATSGGARLFAGADSDQLTLYRGGLNSTLSPGLITTVGRHDVQHFDFESTATQFSGADTDLDGCPDAKEAGLDRAFGGDRDPHDYADWFDVTGDKAVDVADVVSILNLFGAAPGVSQLHDRAVGTPPKLFRSKQANNGIDVADAIANLQAYGHNCT